MKKDLINQTQPFGVVHNMTMHPGEPIVRGGKNALSSNLTERPNHHHDTVHSFADKAPGAMSRATAHNDNPFFWTGKPAA